MRLRLVMICGIGGFLIALLNVRCPAQEVTVGKEWKSEPPADCPFEAADAVVGIFFTGRNKTYEGADTWYDTYLLESRDLTGPWKLASYMKAFGEEAYFVNLPSKFIAADGKTLWLSYSHGWGHKTPNPPGGKYAWCLQEIKLLGR